MSQQLKEKLYSAAKWVFSSPAKTYAVITWLWCFCVILILSSTDHSRQGFSRLGFILGTSAGAGFAGMLDMIALRSSWGLAMEEKWRTAAIEKRIPTWMGLVRLAVIVLPYWVYGWVPEKLSDALMRRV
jgi:hypothetical protein